MEAEDTEDVSLSIRRTRLKVAKKINKRKWKFVRCHCSPKYYNRPSLLSTTSKDQGFIPSIPCHVIFVFLDTILVGVLQVEYQNRKESPFDTHPVHMQTFLTAICIYSALLGIKIYAKTRGGYRAQILSYAILLTGSLSSASLLSILLQRQLLWFVLFIWGSIPLILARHLLKSLMCRIIKVVAKLSRVVLDCMFATMVLIFHNKESASGSNNPTNCDEGIWSWE